MMNQSSNDFNPNNNIETSSNFPQFSFGVFSQANDDSNTLAMPSSSTSEGLRGPTNCKTDALFNKARKLNKKLVVFKMKNYYKLTIEDGKEFHECKKKGLKINEENTKLVNDALKKGQRVRRDGRNFIVVADDNKYQQNRIINNQRVGNVRNRR